MMAALAAGSKAVPFGDNGRVYAELEKELASLRREPQQGGCTANAARDHGRAA